MLSFTTLLIRIVFISYYVNVCSMQKYNSITTAASYNICCKTYKISMIYIVYVTILVNCMKYNILVGK